MSNRAYIGIYLLPSLITLLAFKSLYFGLSTFVYFLVLKQDVFCLSVIPKNFNLKIKTKYNIMTQHNAIKLFETKKVRTIWDDKEEKWGFYYHI